MRLALQRIADRCHVGDSNRSVINYTVSRLRNGRATFRSLPRSVRRQLMQTVINRHARNRALYTRVMRGSI